VGGCGEWMPPWSDGAACSADGAARALHFARRRGALIAGTEDEAVKLVR